MTMQSLPANSGWRLFKIQHELDFASGPVIHTAITHMVDDGSHNLLIDLEDVDTADELGVDALASAIRQIMQAYPKTRVAFVVRSGWLANALERRQFAGDVRFFRHGADALEAIAPAAHRAA